MTKQEITLIYNKNIIELQELTLRKLARNNPFLEETKCRKKDLNKEHILCLKRTIKVLKRNYKRDLKDCENEPTDDLVSAEKVEEIVNAKVEQSDF